MPSHDHIRLSYPKLAFGELGGELTSKGGETGRQEDRETGRQVRCMRGTRNQNNSNNPNNPILLGGRMIGLSIAQGGNYDATWQGCRTQTPGVVPGYLRHKLGASGGYRGT